jgi:hypothetical protein
LSSFFAQVPTHISSTTTNFHSLLGHNLTNVGYFSSTMVLPFCVKTTTTLWL